MFSASGGQGFALHPCADRALRGQGLGYVFGDEAKTAGGQTTTSGSLEWSAFDGG